MLGNGYGGGFIVTPSLYVTKLPYPNGPPEGIPPGYGSASVSEVSIVISNSSFLSASRGVASQPPYKSGFESSPTILATFHGGAKPEFSSMPTAIIESNAVKQALDYGRTTKVVTGIVGATDFTKDFQSYDTATPESQNQTETVQLTSAQSFSGTVYPSDELNYLTQQSPYMVGGQSTFIFGTKHVASASLAPLPAVTSKSFVRPTSQESMVSEVSSFAQSSEAKIENKSSHPSGKTANMIIEPLVAETGKFGTNSNLEHPKVPVTSGSAINAAATPMSNDETKYAFATELFKSGTLASSVQAIPEVESPVRTSSAKLEASPSLGSPIGIVAGPPEELSLQVESSLEVSATAPRNAGASQPTKPPTGDYTPSSTKDKLPAVNNFDVPTDSTFSGSVAAPTNLANGSSNMSEIGGFTLSPSVTSLDSGSGVYPSAATINPTGSLPMIEGSSLGGIFPPTLATTIPTSGISTTASANGSSSKADIGASDTTASQSSGTFIIAGITAATGQSSSISEFNSEQRLAAYLANYFNKFGGPTAGGSSPAVVASSIQQIIGGPLSSVNSGLIATSVGYNSSITLSSSEPGSAANQGGIVTAGSTGFGTVPILLTGVPVEHNGPSLPTVLGSSAGSQGLSASVFGSATATGSDHNASVSLLLNPTSLRLFEGAASKVSLGILRHLPGLFLFVMIL